MESFFSGFLIVAQGINEPSFFRVEHRRFFLGVVTIFFFFPKDDFS